MRGNKTHGLLRAARVARKLNRAKREFIFLFFSSKIGKSGGQKHKIANIRAKYDVHLDPKHNQLVPKGRHVTEIVPNVHVITHFSLLVGFQIPKTEKRDERGSKR